MQWTFGQFFKVCAVISPKTSDCDERAIQPPRLISTVPSDVLEMLSAPPPDGAVDGVIAVEGTVEGMVSAFDGVDDMYFFMMNSVTECQQ